jgi:SAM-dependent methyltransferase
MFLDLGEQPWCNDFVSENALSINRYPLKVYFCNKCTAVQVGHTVPKEKMYSNHLYLSGTTETMHSHFKKIAEELVSKFRLDSDSLVLDIGSNDGTFLEKFRAHRCVTVGIDPCERACMIAKEKGIVTYEDYFNEESSRIIEQSYGKADIISAANVFYHIEELHSVCKGIKQLLSDEGVLVIQGSYLPNVVDKNEFDILYHEHLLLYRMETLDKLLKIHGLELFDVTMSPVHGGSFIAYATHIGKRTRSVSLENTISEEQEKGYDSFKTYQDFAKRAVNICEQLNSILTELKDKGKKVYALGAPAKGTVLINYCGIDSNKVALALEKNSFKFGKFVPGTDIEIVDEKRADKADVYLLLAWNFAEEILKKFNSLTQFIVPFPKPHFLKGTKDGLDISIVIKCKDDFRVFDCIKSIDEEVDVVVSLMPNKTIQRKLEALGVRYVTSPPGNLAITSNRGIDSAKHEKVIIMDSDTTFASGCIRELYKALDLYNVARPKIVYQRDRKVFLSGIIGRCRAFVNEYPLTYTPGLGINKTIKDRIGGRIFDEDIPWAEDDDLYQRISEASIPVAYVDHAEVYHTPISLKHDLRAAYRIGGGVRLSVEKNNRDAPEYITNWLNRFLKGEQLREFWEMFKVKGGTVAIYNILWAISYYLGFYLDGKKKG